ncbi:hypothetical protein EDB80DRAFT_737626 [Ilyonectria destructans]|nr:hypothetical protein EDB80DRAFT_737626 [Ilyonectria destructans]
MALAVSTKEMERVQHEEPELAKEMNDQGKGRTRRLISIRREGSSDKRSRLLDIHMPT